MRSEGVTYGGVHWYHGIIGSHVSPDFARARERRDDQSYASTARSGSGAVSREGTDREALEAVRSSAFMTAASAAALAGGCRSCRPPRAPGRGADLRVAHWRPRKRLRSWAVLWGHLLERVFSSQRYLSL